MLPVALALIGMRIRYWKATKLSSVLLFLLYGCAIGSIGTPSGGGRNAIMIGYLVSLVAEIYLDWVENINVNSRNSYCEFNIVEDFYVQKLWILL